MGLRTCKLCGSPLGLDITQRPMCYGCGPANMVPSVPTFLFDSAPPSPPAAPEGRKDDGGKPRWDLLPWGPLEEVAAVLEFGARKYAPNNWQKVEGGSWRYLRAGIGHLAARARGERTDPESGLSHLAHAACCVLFLMWFDKKEGV